MTIDDVSQAIEDRAEQPYVYIIRKPRLMKDEWSSKFPLGTPFYVGTGIGKRVLDHEKQAKQYSGEAYPPPPGINLHKIHTIQLIWTEGGIPEYDIEFYDVRISAIDREKELIEQIGRRDLGNGPLTNLTAGGDGLTEPSEEVRERIANAQKELWKDSRYKKSHADERKKYFKDPKNREKQSLAIRKAYQQDPELRQRNIEVQKEAQSRPKVAEKKSVAMQGYWDNPHWAEKTKKAQSDGWTKDKCNENSERKKQWLKDNPEEVKQMKEKHKLAVQKPEYRKKRSEAAKRQMKDPKMRQRLVEAAKTPEAIEKFKKSRAQTMKYRAKIKQKCKDLIINHNIEATAPDSRASVKEWEIFKTQIEDAIAKRNKQ